jgi:flagellar biosynthetic protein FliQ
MDLMYVANSTVWVILIVGIPSLFVSMIIGLLISIFQAVTQVSDAALAFVPKMIFVSAFIVLTLPWIGEKIEAYTQDIWGLILVFGQ